MDRTLIIIVIFLLAGGILNFISDIYDAQNDPKSEYFYWFAAGTTIIGLLLFLFNFNHIRELTHFL